MSVLEIAQSSPPPTWEDLFTNCKEEFKEIDKFLAGKEFFPLQENIFRAFHLTPLPQVKAVLIGQDPYHQYHDLDPTIPRAQGLSFSVSSDDSIPSSLKNIFKELKNDIDGFVVPQNGNLEKWAKEGILLLNSSLTVLPNSAGSCGNIWCGFIDAVIRTIRDTEQKCVFILLGRDAQKLKSRLVSNNIAIIEAVHPSGLSANRGFFGSKVFSKTNDELKKMGVAPINWKL